MEAQFLIAGFGGQGVLLIGQLLAKAAMHEGPLPQTLIYKDLVVK